MSFNFIEPAIGDVITHNDKQVRCVAADGDSCQGCIFEEGNFSACIDLVCVGFTRTDRTDVIFKSSEADARSAAEDGGK